MTPADSKVAISRRIGCRLHYRDREGATTALAEAELQVENRDRARFAKPTVAPGSLERCPAIVYCPQRGEGGGQERSCDGDDPVDDHRHTCRGSSDDEAGESCDLQSTDFGRDRDRIGVARQPSEGRFDHLGLVVQHGVVDTGPVPGDMARLVPVSAAISAADGVVLPIPMSPVTSISWLF